MSLQRLVLSLYLLVLSIHVLLHHTNVVESANNSLSFSVNTMVGYDPNNGNNIPSMFSNLNPFCLSFSLAMDGIFMYDGIRKAIIKLDLETNVISKVQDMDFQASSILETSRGILFTDTQGRYIKLLSNNTVTVIAGVNSTGYSGDGIANETKLNYPKSLVEDKQGNVYFIDSNNYRLRKLSADNIITTIAGEGKNDNGGDGGAALKANLKNPSGLVLIDYNLFILCDTVIRRIDLLTSKIYSFSVESPFKFSGIFNANGTIYVHSATAIGKILSTKKVSVIAGSSTLSGTSENNIPAKDALFKQISSIGVLPSESIIYIFDSSNNDIRFINETLYINLLGGVKSLKTDLGYRAPYFFTNDPTGLVELPNGDLVFSHSGGIAKLSHGLVTSVVEASSPILGLAYYEKEDELYFVESSSSIQKLKNGEIIHVAGSSTGQSADNIPATKCFLSYPYGITIDQNSGDIYFTEQSGNRVRKISGGVVTTLSGNGQAGDSGDNDEASKALVNNPSGIYYSQSGELYFADSGNNRIRKINVNGIISTVAGANVCTAKEGSVLATETVLRNPSFVYVYPNGDYLFTETNSHIVRRVSNGKISTIAGIGISGEGPDSVAALQSALTSPKAIIHSYNLKQVVVVDKTNRVRTLTANCEKVYVLDTFGSYCIPYCFNILANETTNVCSGKGECTSFNSCSCISSYGGYQCSISKCSGVLATDPTTCSGNGKCLEGICDCGGKFIGKNCEIPTCFEIASNDSQVCGGRGRCSNWNTCECSDKYSGNKCQYSMCFGISANSPTVCSGRGMCSSPDNCICQQGSSGAICEVSIEEIEKQNRERIVIIISSVAGSVLLLCCCLIWTVFIFVFTNRKLKQRNNAERDMEKRLLQFEFNDSQSSTKESNYLSSQQQKSYVIPIEDITFVKKIGIGGFSNVYLGKWRQSSVAIKSVEIQDDRADETFEKEAQTLCTLKHPNIITLFGISFSDTRRLLIVEYFEKGSLDKYIEALMTKKIHCSLETKIKYLMHIANGMAYLHSFKPNPIVHRDLKPANVLLSENGILKICDFGLSRRLNYETKSTMTSNIGTFYYCANEMLNGTNQKKYATALDVFSFGLIAWELLFEEANPYDYSNPTKVFFNMSEDNLSRYSKLSPFNVPTLVSQGLRPPIPFDSAESCKDWCNMFASSEQENYLSILQLGNMIRSCWDEKPEQRPSFFEIVKMLSRLERNFRIESD